VVTNFAQNRPDSTPAWVNDLQGNGFRPELPTVWLLEGLMMYLNVTDQMTLMKNIGLISAKGSIVFHDAISKTQEYTGIRVASVPFLGVATNMVKSGSNMVGSARLPSATSAVFMSTGSIKSLNSIMAMTHLQRHCMVTV